jgi:hypothetical protein
VIIDELGHSTVSHVIPCVGETDNQSPPDDVVVEAAKGVGAQSQSANPRREEVE